MAPNAWAVTDVGTFLVVRCHLLILRHGQSEWNEQGKWQGQADPPLTALGERQATLAAEHIARAGLTFDTLLASDLQRARRTAAIIGERLGVGDVVVDRDLRERDAGVWEGLTRAQINERWPGQIEARQWPEGFESERSVAARLLPALRRLLADSEHTLLIAHAGVLKTLDALAGLGDEPVPNLCGRFFIVSAAHDEGDAVHLEAGERAEFAHAPKRAGELAGEPAGELAGNQLDVTIE